MMEHLLQHPEGLGVSDMTHQLGFPKNSVYRIVNTLHKHGYLNRHADTKRFVLSRKMFSMAYSGPNEKSLMENAIDVMRDLRDEVKETVLISVVSDDQGLVLEQMPGLYPFRFVVEPGTRRTVHASSHGKAIMAFMREQERDGLLDRVEMTRFTKQTITTRKAMERELERIRARGYAFDMGEEDDGIRCVSAPVLDQYGVSVAALTTTGPAFRMPDPEMDAIGQSVKKHADRVSRRLGYGLVNA
ncbi:MAG: IclR family transcriptional regulator [bacterium]|nr:IclR family transcriptional regulator [bacterium]